MQGRDERDQWQDQGDILLTPVQPLPAQKHGVSAFAINGQKVDATYLQGPTVPLNLSGLPGMLMRFGTTRGGMPIGVQLVSNWLSAAFCSGASCPLTS